MSPEARTKRFADDALEVVSDVRDAFARIIEERCPGSKRSVSDLAAAFGVHRKLAWQVSRVTYSDDPYDAAQHMPTQRGLGAWLDAAERVGVPEPLVVVARDAGERFAAFAARHAESTTEFEMMLDSVGSAGAEQADERWREHAFLGNSYIFGARCRVLLGISVLQPSDDRDGWFHCAQVRGLIAYRQTRPGVNWMIGQSVVARDAGADLSPDRRPLDPDAAGRHSGVPVIPSFCSTPMPELRRRITPDGMANDEFVDGPIGRTGERTIVTGEVIRNISRVHATAEDKFGHFGVGIRIPAETLIFDLFVDRNLFGDVQREIRVFSDLCSPVTWRPEDALPVPERIVPMGRGVSLAQTPEIPGYPDLASAVFEMLGAESRQYELYRIRMVYPPMPTTVMVRQAFPEPDAS